jgi:hypothetical protein
MMKGPSGVPNMDNGARRACVARAPPSRKSIGRAVGIEGNGPSIRLYANNEPALKLVKVT